MATAYIKDEQGGTFIPASQRPDGTWRKPRRVREGYVPQEEVPLYESLGKQFQKNKCSHPVGMSAEYVAAHKARVETERKKKIVSTTPVMHETKKKKKGKNKSTKSICDALANTTISEMKTDHIQASARKSSSEFDQSTKVTEFLISNTIRQDGKSILNDSMRRLKNLRKKIREIESLECKIENGDIKNPEREVLEKISRKKNILDDIKFLESNQ